MSSEVSYEIIKERCSELVQQIGNKQIASQEALENAINAMKLPDAAIISVLTRVLCRNKDISIEFFDEKEDLYEKMNFAYWNDYSWIEGDDPRVKKLFEISKLLYLWGDTDLEDFRPLARMSYHRTESEERDEKRQEITRIFLQKASDDGIQGEELIRVVRDNYEFIGIPIPSPTDIVKVGIELGIPALDVILEKKVSSQFLELIENRLQYLPELIIGRKFEEIISEAHLWISHSMATKIMNEFLASALKQIQEELQKDPISLDNVHKIGKDIFRQHGLTDAAQEPFPLTYEAIIQKIGLQIAPSTPLSPTRFELVPKEALNHMLGRLSFANPVNKIELVFLGGGGIGRSGILVITSNGSVLLDFGYSVTNTQVPRFVPEMRFLDAILVSHAHLDHSGGLPILYRESGYKGPWYGAPSTHEMVRMLLANSSELVKSSFRRSLYRGHPVFKHVTNPSNLARVHQNFIPLELGKQVEIAPEVLVTPYQAGHIYGSRCLLLEIAGTTILYTGDFNLNPTGLFPESIENKIPMDADYTLFDGTYYNAPPFDYNQTDQILTDIVQKSERTIIPAFSLGRSQEIVQRLENAGLTKEKKVVLLGMSARIARYAGLKGKYELHEKGIPPFEKDMVIIAGSGMLSGRSAGTVLFQEVRQDPNAGVILCGWMAKRTLGWDLLNGNVSHKCQLGYARISAHCSSDKLNTFIDQLSGKKIMLHCPVPASDVAHKDLIRPDYESRIRIK